MTPRVSLDDVTARMEEMLAREGAKPLGVGWRTRENQELRFAQLLRIFDEAVEPFTVNDLGCGFADLYGYIHSRNLPMTRYRGYDLSAKMLEVAKGRVGSDAELVQAERLTENADYSFACGIFNMRGGTDEAEWGRYMKETIRDLDQKSERGFAFNSLTTYVEYREKTQFYADPAEMFRFCKEEISPRVALLHDYPLWEWTILVRKEEA